MVNLFRSITAGITLAAMALGTAACSYSIEDTKIALIDRVYESLPQEVQEEYATDMFLGSDYDTRVDSILQLNKYNRISTIESVINLSEYGVQREITFYGLGKLDNNDSLEAIKISGQNILGDLGERIIDAYETLKGGD